MISIVDRLRLAYSAWRVRRRRRKLLFAYAKVGRVRHGLGPGISPLFYAYDRLQDEDLATTVVGEDGSHLVWHWPGEEEPSPDVEVAQA